MSLEKKNLKQKIKIIINAIKEKGGDEIISMNLKPIENSP